MQAWQIDTFGAAPRLTDRPDPVPQPDQVTIAVEAAGLNFADLLMADGKYQVRPAPPFVPGFECAGRILAVGAGVSARHPDLRPGAVVVAVPGQGALAERVAAPAATVLRLPDGADPVRAAAFPIAYGTSHLALTARAGLLAGETLLVSGAGGGVGLTAVAIGRLLGARVWAVLRGAAKAEAVRAAGAERIFDSDAPDLRDALRAAGGVDVFYDTIGGAVFDAGLGAMRPDGRILAIGFASGQVPQVPANRLLVRNVAVIGFWWGDWLARRPDATRASLGEMWAALEDGRLPAPAITPLPFADLPEAWRRLRDRSVTGKLVLDLQARSRASD
jgi:NADPH:quinone reductase